MKNILSLILLLLSVSVFGQKIPVMQKKSTGKEIHIDVYSAFQKKAPMLKASQFVEDIEFVPLETTDDCLLDQFLNKNYSHEQKYNLSLPQSCSRIGPASNRP